MTVFSDKLTHLLAGVQRPGRYSGNEFNNIRKDWDETELHFALAFPDIYEIGMSHLGMGILYHILNRESWIAAERVFSPWVDMEAAMRSAELPLFSLESRRAVADFDILGISLQYELQYSNVLNLLDLAGIPLRSSDRSDFPLVIAGGPCSFNPEPLAEFLDAILLGDGEEAVLEIADCVRQAKKAGLQRQETLSRLAGIPGVYVPSLFDPANPVSDPKHQIRARAISRLSPDNYPGRPLVPLVEVTHDRLSVEIMRGCTRGCRFCNAGMLYRPVRLRPVNEIVSQVQDSIMNSGYDEVSLVSLSTSDYPCLPELVSSLRAGLGGRDVAVSYPSLRPDTFTEQMALMSAGLRRSGLTLAPEAGTQRLRDVINKNNCEEDLLKAVTLAFKNGWRNVKLYFMIGLPTETDEDVAAIPKLVEKVVKIGRSMGRRDVHVSISPFSPKPHTPFQWAAQDTIESFERKVRIIRDNMGFKEVKLKWRDPVLSRLEAVLGRGDRRLGQVIFEAWKRGARFDAWSDRFDNAVWTQSFRDCGIEMDDYTRSRDLDEALPWDHLQKGVTRKYLKAEWESAHKVSLTPDCTEGCNDCGLQKEKACKERILKRQSGTNGGDQVQKEFFMPRQERHEADKSMKRTLRFQYEKQDPVRYTSHLETVKLIERVFRRARLPVAMSQGFHAHSRIATGPPLPLGYTGEAEYLDVTFDGHIPKDPERVLNKHVPEGLNFTESMIVFGKAESLNGVINTASYLIDWIGLPDIANMKPLTEEFMSRNQIIVNRERKGRIKKVDIRQYVLAFECKDEGVLLELRLTSGGTARVDEVILNCLKDTGFPAPPTTLIGHRQGLFVERLGRRLTPLESLEE